jgi:Xaa-Pro aminopeptidase
VNVLMFGATDVDADLFQAVPIAIIDPFVYLEVGGKRVVVLGVFEHDRVRALDAGLEVRDPSDFGRTGLLKDGWDYDEAAFEVALRVCREYGVDAAAVPYDFPLAVAEHLRAGGVDVQVDLETFRLRRRVKTPHQIEGIRRAQAAADASMALAAQMLRECRDGLTADQVRDAMSALCAERGCVLPDDVVVAVNGQGASGHDKGSGPITRGDRIIVDIWPRDRESRCFADMTRSFVAGGGEPDAEQAEYWRMTKEAFDAVLPEIRPGVTGRRLYDLTCDVYEAAGQPTLRNTEGSLDRGFFHSLGHGVGIEIHEEPGLGLAGRHELVPGDVITIEPGCYRPGYGGVRLEDLILVTEDGCENLTQFPYELQP